MDVSLLAADDATLRKIFGGLVDGSAGTRKTKGINPFTGEILDVVVPDVDIDYETLTQNSWQIDDARELISEALRCKMKEVDRELELVFLEETLGISVHRVSDRAAKSLADSQQLDGLAADLEARKRFYVVEESG
jgi:hypothetical protein